MESPALRRGRRQRKDGSQRAPQCREQHLPRHQSKRCAGGPRRRKLRRLAKIIYPIVCLEPLGNPGFLSHRRIGYCGEPPKRCAGGKRLAMRWRFADLHYDWTSFWGALQGGGFLVSELPFLVPLPRAGLRSLPVAADQDAPCFPHRVLELGEPACPFDLVEQVIDRAL